ncbi:MAG: EamA family transporter [Thermoanaerobaculales bacterium]
MTSPSRLGLAFAYAAVCVIWGTTYLAIKVGLESFDPFFYAGVRYTLAALVSLVLARFLGVPFGGPLRRWWPAFGVGVLFVAICNGLVFWAETALDSGFTALLMTTSPLWTALLAPLLGADRGPGRGGWLGILLGFGGTVLLLQPWRVGAVPLAAALGVEVSVVVWAVGSLWVRRIRQDFHPMALSIAQMAAGAAVLLAVAALRGRALVGPLTTRALLALGFLVVFGSCIAFLAYFYLLRHWTATRVATSTYLNPVVALLLGATLLHEAVTPAMLVGAAVVFAGVTLVLREQAGSPA